MVVNGILISHGKAQKHIWAYVVGYQQTGTTAVPTSKYICPCSGAQCNSFTPFIGNDYYCDSGVDSDLVKGVFYTTPLWNGEGCIPPTPGEGCHGFVGLYLFPLLTILSYACAIVIMIHQVTKTQPWIR